MKRSRVLVALLCAGAMLGGSAGAALAVGGPNSPGDSGKFNPNSGPCQGPNDQPNCPGPQH